MLSSEPTYIESVEKCIIWPKLVQYAQVDQIKHAAKTMHIPGIDCNFIKDSMEYVSIKEQYANVDIQGILKQTYI